MEAGQVVTFIVLAGLAVGFGLLAHRQAAALGLPGAAVTVVGAAAVAVVAPKSAR